MQFAERKITVQDLKLLTANLVGCELFAHPSYIESFLPYIDALNSIVVAIEGIIENKETTVDTLEGKLDYRFALLDVIEFLSDPHDLTSDKYRMMANSIAAFSEHKDRAINELLRLYSNEERKINQIYDQRLKAALAANEEQKKLISEEFVSAEADMNKFIGKIINSLEVITEALQHTNIKNFEIPTTTDLREICRIIERSDKVLNNIRYLDSTAAVTLSRTFDRVLTLEETATEDQNMIRAVLISLGLVLFVVFRDFLLFPAFAVFVTTFASKALLHPEINLELEELAPILGLDRDVIKAAIVNNNVHYTTLRDSTITMLASLDENAKRLQPQIVSEMQDALRSLALNSPFNTNIAMINEFASVYIDNLHIHRDLLAETFTSELYELKEQLETTVDELESNILEFVYVEPEEKFSRIKMVDSIPAYAYDSRGLNLGELEVAFKAGLLVISYGPGEREAALNTVKLIVNTICERVNPTKYNMTFIDTQKSALEFRSCILKDFTSFVAEKDKREEFISEMSSLAKYRCYEVCAGYKDLSAYIDTLPLDAVRAPKYQINVFSSYSEVLDSAVFKSTLPIFQIAGIYNIVLFPEEDLEIRSADPLSQENKKAELAQEYLSQVEQLWSIRDDELTIQSNYAPQLVNSKYISLARSVVNDKTVIESVKQASLALARAVPSIRPDIFVDKILNDDVRYKMNTRNGILRLFVGYIDGDITRPHYVNLGTGEHKYHVLIAGNTGMGKSVLLSQIINSIVEQYPPEEVELIYCDLKIAEARWYSGERTIPNASIIAGTMNPLYFISILVNYLDAEMVRRYELFSSYGVQGFKEFREIQHQRGETPLPLQMIIIDEFAAAYREMPEDKQEPMKIVIEKLAQMMRAAGMYMNFTSQDIDEKVPDKVINQFGSRLCLKVSADISKKIIGNSEAAEIPPFSVIHNAEPSMAGDNRSHNTFCRIPFLTNEYKEERLRVANEYYVRNNLFKFNPEMFDENLRAEHTQLLSMYKRYSWTKGGDNEGLVIFGDKTIYKSQKMPEHMLIAQDFNSNIFVYGSKLNCIYDILNTIAYNIYSKQNSVILYKTASAGYKTLVNNNFVAKDFRNMVYNFDFTDILKLVGDELTRREADLDNLKNEPLMLVMLSAVSQSNIYIGYTDLKEKLESLMIKAPAFKIVFCVYDTTVAGMGGLLAKSRYIFTSQLARDDSFDIFGKNYENYMKNETMGLYKDMKSVADPIVFKPYQFPKVNFEEQRSTVDESIYKLDV